ncbi:MAG: glycoside hydrolase family 15 [Sporichthyaceae bacterium]
MRAPRARRAVPAVALVAGLILAVLGSAEGSLAAPAEQPLRSAGLSGNADPSAFVRVLLPPDAAGSYVPGSSVLESSAPRLAALLDRWPGRRDAADPSGIAWARDWLRSGTVPGDNAAERAVAQRALLDLALLTEPGGASIANPFGAWNYAWPRDAAWHAAAFAVTGHAEEALRILQFFARTQDGDGTWAARFHADGSPVRDGRARQLDAVGWLPWATWLWWRAAEDRAALDALWPMVTTAADAAVTSLGANGLPRPSSDYTEQAESRSTLGTAAPLLLGLRAAVDLATARGVEADRWVSAARRLDAAITEEFGSSGYRRYPDAAAGPDSAITFLAAPLATPAAGLPYSAVAATAGELLMPSGGLRPGNMRGVRRHTFTPATAMFALAAAGARDEAGFRRWYGWLVEHRTQFDAFPEKVSGSGSPGAVAPLGWTSSIVVLALATRDGAVPTPPAP